MQKVFVDLSHWQALLGNSALYGVLFQDEQAGNAQHEPAEGHVFVDPAQLPDRDIGLDGWLLEGVQQYAADLGIPGIDTPERAALFVQMLEVIEGTTMIESTVRYIDLDEAVHGRTSELADFDAAYQALVAEYESHPTTFISPMTNEVQRVSETVGQRNPATGQYERTRTVHEDANVYEFRIVEKATLADIDAQKRAGRYGPLRSDTYARGRLWTLLIPELTDGE